MKRENKQETVTQPSVAAQWAKAGASLRMRRVEERYRGMTLAELAKELRRISKKRHFAADEHFSRLFGAGIEYGAQELEQWLVENQSNRGNERNEA